MILRELQYEVAGCKNVIGLLFLYAHPRLGRETSQKQSRCMVGIKPKLNNIDMCLVQDVKLKFGWSH